MGCLQCQPEHASPSSAGLSSLGSSKVSPRLSKVTRENFVITNVLGEGGFGKVFAAQGMFVTDTSWSSQWFAMKEVKRTELQKHKSGIDMMIGE